VANFRWSFSGAADYIWNDPYTARYFFLTICRLLWKSNMVAYLNTNIKGNVSFPDEKKNKP
jgi:hypothetical protein